MGWDKAYVSRQVGIEKAPRERKTKEGEERGKISGAGSWPDTEILAGKGSGYQPPTAALG